MSPPDRAMPFAAVTLYVRWRTSSTPPAVLSSSSHLPITQQSQLIPWRFDREATLEANLAQLIKNLAHVIPTLAAAETPDQHTILHLSQLRIRDRAVAVRDFLREFSLRLSDGQLLTDASSSSLNRQGHEVDLGDLTCPLLLERHRNGATAGGGGAEASQRSRRTRLEQGGAPEHVDRPNEAIYPHIVSITPVYSDDLGPTGAVSSTSAASTGPKKSTDAAAQSSAEQPLSPPPPSLRPVSGALQDFLTQIGWQWLEPFLAEATIVSLTELCCLASPPLALILNKSRPPPDHPCRFVSLTKAEIAYWLIDQVHEAIQAQGFPVDWRRRVAQFCSYYDTTVSANERCDERKWRDVRHEYECDIAESLETKSELVRKLKVPTTTKKATKEAEHLERACCPSCGFELRDTVSAEAHQAMQREMEETHQKLRAQVEDAEAQLAALRHTIDSLTQRVGDSVEEAKAQNLKIEEQKKWIEMLESSRAFTRQQHHNYNNKRSATFHQEEKPTTSKIFAPSSVMPLEPVVQSRLEKREPAAQHAASPLMAAPTPITTTTTTDAIDDSRTAKAYRQLPQKQSPHHPHHHHHRSFVGHMAESLRTIVSSPTATDNDVQLVLKKWRNREPGFHLFSDTK